MKRLYPLAVLLLGMSHGAPPTKDPTPMAASTIGEGQHGYDILIGIWSCTNSMPSPMSGPENTTFNAAKTGVDGTLSIHMTGRGFDAAGYLVFVEKTKTWRNPIAYVDGSTSNQSTQQTGSKTVWMGTAFDASSGKRVRVRDTYTFVSPLKFVDVGETNVNGVWKTESHVTCSKEQ
jgi:hypothetical protein